MASTSAWSPWSSGRDRALVGGRIEGEGDQDTTSFKHSRIINHFEELLLENTDDIYFLDV